MKSHGIESACHGKIPFDTLKKCSQAAGSLNRKGGKPVNAYKCPNCGKFHYGHESRRGKKIKDNSESGTRFKENYVKDRLKEGFCLIRNAG